MVLFRQIRVSVFTDVVDFRDVLCIKIIGSNGALACTESENVSPTTWSWKMQTVTVSRFCDIIGCVNGELTSTAYRIRTPEGLSR